MHQVLEINRYCRTSFLKLKNTITNTIDVCFDDSRVISDQNFDFMRVGKSYQCKIMLFGEVVKCKDDSAVLCRLISKEQIGRRLFAKVRVDFDEYFIPVDYFKDNSVNQEFYYAYTRKDLIQVEEIIHADCLT